MAKKNKPAATAAEEEVTLFLNGKNHVFKNKAELDKRVENGTVDPTNILEGIMKDGYANYKLQLMAGMNSGKSASYNGKTCLVTNDLTLAFRELRPHMAYIDDLFKINGVTIIDIANAQNHELTSRFTIHGFQIKGTGANEAVVIIGEKYVEEVGDHVSWRSPKIMIGEHSHYKWIENLNTVVAKCREEVRLYHHGKYTKEVAEVISMDPAQKSILDEDAAASFDNATVD